MVITPNTDLYLVKVPLEINDDNQLTFANASAQYTYFSSLPRFSGDGKFTYQRKDGVIRFGALIDDILSYNYVMYRNDSYTNKWFYAFITGMEYVNDNMTSITIKTDTWQTWQFDLTYKPTLIDREHQNTDVAGDNTLPERLELGEFVVNGDTSNFGTSPSFVTVVEVSQIENYTNGNQTLVYQWVDGSHNETPVLNDIIRGTTPLIVSGANDVKQIRDVYDSAGLADAIVNVYMLPAGLVGSSYQIQIASLNVSSPKTCTAIVPADKTGVYSINSKTISRPTSVDNFTPKNKKVLTYPYCYFNVSNNAGTSIPFHYEDFGSTITFNVEGTFGVSGNIKAIPIGYKNISASENALDYSISGAKYPVCSWKSDSYTNWLTQNAVNMNTQWSSTALSGALSTAGSGFAGGNLGMVGGVVQTGANLISLATDQHLAKTKANFIPDQVHGNCNAGELVWAKYQSAFTVLPMSIKAEYARCIDEYFSQFGYKCNRVKLPNIIGRRNWNFVKTVGCYIEADIPQDDLQEIKSMFDKGVTFWHNPATFADYSQNNDIV